MCFVEVGILGLKRWLNSSLDPRYLSLPIPRLLRRDLLAPNQVEGRVSGQLVCQQCRMLRLNHRRCPLHNYPVMAQLLHNVQASRPARTPLDCRQCRMHRLNHQRHPQHIYPVMSQLLHNIQASRPARNPLDRRQCRMHRLNPQRLSQLRQNIQAPCPA